MRDGDPVVGLAQARVEEKGGQGEEREMGTDGSVSRLEIIPREGERGGKGCGKRDGVGRQDRVDWRERTKRSSSVALWSLFHPCVVVGRFAN